MVDEPAGGSFFVWSAHLASEWFCCYGRCMAKGPALLKAQVLRNGGERENWEVFYGLNLKKRT